MVAGIRAGFESRLAEDVTRRYFFNLVPKLRFRFPKIVTLLQTEPYTGTVATEFAKPDRYLRGYRPCLPRDSLQLLAGDSELRGSLANRYSQSGKDIFPNDPSRMNRRHIRLPFHEKFFVHVSLSGKRVAHLVQPSWFGGKATVNDIRPLARLTTDLWPPRRDVFNTSIYRLTSLFMVEPDIDKVSRMVYKLSIPRYAISVGGHMKTQTTIRVDEHSYTQAKEILSVLGLSYSQAINIFNNMVVSTKGLPFAVKIPNEETLQAMEEAKNLNGDSVTLDNFKR